MRDLLGREINYLRISLTQDCNLNCIYCHREGQENIDTTLTLKILERMVKDFASLGIKRVKLTGGEPLLRTDIVDIVRTIAYISEIEEISLVTNGFFLPPLAEQLKAAGLNRVSIGCDTVDNCMPKNIHTAWPAIQAAKKAGLDPIKINIVVLKGINDHQIMEMIEFARDQQVILQLNELIKLNIDEEFHALYYLNLGQIEESLARKATRIITRKMQARRQYFLGKTTVEVIKPMHQIFCQNCNKIRITSDGKIKPCLMVNKNLVEYHTKDSILEALKRRGKGNDKDDRYFC
ncbi:MAG: GTP 3',8-cyclase MoaA [Candidatus Aminicenantia bacterium]